MLIKYINTKSFENKQLCHIFIRTTGNILECGCKTSKETKMFILTANSHFFLVYFVFMLYLLSSGNTACERHFSHHWMVTQQPPSLGSSLYHVKESLWDTCLFIDLCQHNCCHWGHGRWFEHHGIA